MLKISTCSKKNYSFSIGYQQSLVQTIIVLLNTHNSLSWTLKIILTHLVQIVVVVSDIHNSFSWILNILLFLQDNMPSPSGKMFLVQHFGSFGLSQYNHVIYFSKFLQGFPQSPIFQSQFCPLKIMIFDIVLTTFITLR